MQSLSIAFVTIVIVLLAGSAIGGLIRRAVLSGGKGAEAIDPTLGIAFSSLLLMASLRLTGSVDAGAIAMSATAIVASVQFRWEPKFHRQVAALGIASTFVLAVAVAYIPLFWAFGAELHAPEIFDAPKHIMAITSVATATQWPPPSPFMPGLKFAYNFGFYAIPAAIVKAIGDPRVAITMTACFSVISVVCTLSATAAVSRTIWGNGRGATATIICATWLAGATPLIVQTYPPLGFRLFSEGIITQMAWVDDPFISAIFAPQHYFAAGCVLGIIYCSAMNVSVWRRAVGASIFTISGSLTSLILLPHLCIIFGACMCIAMAASPKSLSDKIAASAVSATCAVIVLPFILEAASWQSGTGGSIIGAPLDLWTLLIIMLAIGPVLLYAIAGATVSVKKTKGCGIYALTAIAITIVLACSLHYSEASVKSTMLLRTLLPVFAGHWLFTTLRGDGRLHKAVVALSLLIAIGASIPAASFFVTTPQKFAKPERNFLTKLQAASAPIYFNGINDQWLAALSGKQTIMDFRQFRPDAYLPPTQREEYAARLQKIDHFGSTVVKKENPEDVVVASGFGLSLRN